MKMKKKNKAQETKKYGSAVDSSAERDALFPEKESHRRIGEFCDGCGRKKNTKKSGKHFLCSECSRS